MATVRSRSSMAARPSRRRIGASEVVQVAGQREPVALARLALAAGLHRQETGHALGHRHRVGSVVERGEAGRSETAAGGLEVLVGHRRAEEVCRDQRVGGTGEQRHQRPTGSRATPDQVDQLVQSGAHRHLGHAVAGHVADQGADDRAGRLVGPHRRGTSRRLRPGCRPRWRASRRCRPTPVVRRFPPGRPGRRRLRRDRPRRERHRPRRGRAGRAASPVGTAGGPRPPRGGRSPHRTGRRPARRRSRG